MEAVQGHGLAPFTHDFNEKCQKSPAIDLGLIWLSVELLWSNFHVVTPGFKAGTMRPDSTRIIPIPQCAISAALHVPLGTTHIFANFTPLVMAELYSTLD